MYVQIGTRVIIPERSLTQKVLSSPGPCGKFIIYILGHRASVDTVISILSQHRSPN